MTEKKIYEVIKDTATAKGMSMTDLAKDLGITYAAIVRLKRMQIGKVTLAKISNRLDLNYEEMLEKMESELPRQVDYEAERRKINHG